MSIRRDLDILLLFICSSFSISCEKDEETIVEPGSSIEEVIGDYEKGLKDDGDTMENEKDETEDENGFTGKDEDMPLKISKYMNQSSPGVSVQGAACYGDYLFQFENYNANVYIYNLRAKTFLEKISLTPNRNNHCNNASFSNIFYQEGDEFPLLYVSGGLVATFNHVQVYRIIHSGAAFLFEKVQEIEFPKASTENRMNSTQAVMSEKFMYVLTKGNNQTFVSVINIPDYTIPSLKLNDNDILEQFEVANFINKQGAVIKDGLMYVMYGVPAWGNITYLRVLNLESHEDIYVFNVSSLGFKQEFEGLAFYNDTLIAATNKNAGIFTFRFANK